MLDEALLLGIASIAAVIAGFTAVTAALTPPGGSWSQVHRIRQRAIVSTSFNVVFEALLLVIAFAWLADVRQAVVLSSALVAIYAAWIVVTRGRQLYPAGGLRTWGGLRTAPFGPLAGGRCAIVQQRYRPGQTGAGTPRGAAYSLHDHSDHIGGAPWPRGSTAGFGLRVLVRSRACPPAIRTSGRRV